MEKNATAMPEISTFQAEIDHHFDYVEQQARELHALDRQVIDLSALCIQQHAELKVLRSYVDPQRGLFGALRLCGLVLTHACQNLVLDSIEMFIGKQRRPQAIRLK